MPRSVDAKSLLASMSIFEGLSGEEVELLLGIARKRELAEGEVLVRKGDPGNQLYGVLEGRLHVTGETETGDEVTFAYMDPGEVIGEIALLDQSPRSATVTALEPTRLLSLHRDEFLALLDSNPQVAVRLAAVLAGRVRKLSTLMEETIFLTLPSRLAMNLVALAQAAQNGEAAGVSLDISLPHTKLAELSGSTPARLAEQLQSWERCGLVTVENGVVTVNGVEGLESLARFLVV